MLFVYHPLPSVYTQLVSIKHRTIMIRHGSLIICTEPGQDAGIILWYHVCCFPFILLWKMKEYICDLVISAVGTSRPGTENRRQIRKDRKCHNDGLTFDFGYSWQYEEDDIIWYNIQIASTAEQATNLLIMVLFYLLYTVDVMSTLFFIFMSWFNGKWVSPLGINRAVQSNLTMYNQYNKLSVLNLYRSFWQSQLLHHKSERAGCTEDKCGTTQHFNHLARL